MGILNTLMNGGGDRDAVVEAALSDRHAAEKRRSELLSDIEKLRSQVAGKRRERAELEFSGGNWATLDEEIVSFEGDVEVKSAAVTFAEGRIKDADHRLWVAAHKDYLKVANKLANKRSKYASLATEALEVYIKARSKLIEANELMLTSWPIAGEPPAGSVASLNTLDDLLARELLRLQGGNSLHRFAPGTLANPFLSLSDLVPLTDEIEQANRCYVAAIEAGPDAPAPMAAPETPAPDMPQPDPDGLDEPQGRTMSVSDAAALMATLNPPTTIEIDNRKGGADA